MRVESAAKPETYWARLLRSLLDGEISPEQYMRIKDERAEGGKCDR